MLTRPVSLSEVEVIEAVPIDEQDIPRTTYGLLVQSAERFGDATAIHVLPAEGDYREPVTFTYRDLLTRVNRIANLFTALGGGPVSTLAPNLPALYPVILAAQAVGVVNPIDPFLGEEHIRDTLRLARSRILVVAAPRVDLGLWDKVTRILPEVPSVENVVVIGGGHRPSLDVPVITLHAAAVQSGQRLVGAAPGRADDVAAYIHTGGTTGAPKLAVHTHRNQTYMAWAMTTAWGFAPHRPVLSGLPVFHAGTLLATTLAPLLAGAPIVSLGPHGYRDPIHRAAFWRIVERYRINILRAAPTVCAMLSQLPVDADISSLELAIVGTGALPSGVRGAFSRHTGVPIREEWGLAEGTCGTTFSPPARAKDGSVGIRMPYQDVRVVAAEGVVAQELPVWTTGRVQVRGPNVFAGYLHDRGGGDAVPEPDVSGVVEGGWLDTGDLGYLDDDGYLWLRGRAGDVDIRSWPAWASTGTWTSPLKAGSASPGSTASAAPAWGVPESTGIDANVADRLGFGP